MTQSLSLYVIEDGLVELLLAREETLADLVRIRNLVPTPAEDIAEAQNALAMIDKTLDEYVSLEARKVDNYHHFFTAAAGLVKQMKEEEARTASRRRRLEAAVAWLKQRAMAAMALAEKKRVEGTSGRYLLAKANGGLAPLLVDGWTDEKGWSTNSPILPDEFVDVTLRMPRTLYLELVALAADAVTTNPVMASLLATAPSNERIRAALAETCRVCAGADVCHCGESMNGYHDTHTPVKLICDACSGTGRRVVPGARLGERGVHLEVR